MFGFFKRTIEKELFYPELPPKQRITRVLEEHVLPVLQPLGFTFDQKELAFIRERGEFTDTVAHSLNWNNNTAAGIVRFNPHATVSYKPFGPWLEQTLGQPAKSIVWAVEFNREGYRSAHLTSGSYCLAARDNRKVMETYLHNVAHVVIPMMSTLHSPAEIIRFHEIERAPGGVAFYIACMIGDRGEAERQFAREAKAMRRYSKDPEMMKDLERKRRMVDALA